MAGPMLRPTRLVLLAAAAATAMLGCVRLPSLDGRLVSVAFDQTAETRLGQASLAQTSAHRGLSGVIALPNGPDAFAARMVLADAAEVSLDAQYYVWHDDMTGALLFDALRRAANRGVRVRLLLDDNNTAGLERILAALDAHPNIQVRLFNPVAHRDWRRVLDYLVDFRRLNRRMHNKSFTVDNQVTIVGGRNVGDEYFGAGENPLFADLDVFAIGPVVVDVSREFDAYWASESSYPADRLLKATRTEDTAIVADAATRVMEDSAALVYRRSLEDSPFVRDLLARRLAFDWAHTTVLSDDPRKGLGGGNDDSLLWPQLRLRLGRPTTRLDLVSPYFVPGSAGTAYFAALAKSGVTVDVLTNSLEATDVAAVHAGYAKRRSTLVDAGVSLFELKLASLGGARPRYRIGTSSASSLHAKTIAVDGTRVFIGSFNFDPRSARLNTEMGFIIESPRMAGTIADAFRATIPERAYRVTRGADGLLEWLDVGPQGTRRYGQEPGTGFWRRLTVIVASLLPIEWLL
jgi:putative cardiolipin synthase